MDKLFGSDVRELKLGSTFASGSGNSSQNSFHTLKCDFKPMAIDPNQVATMDVSSNNQVQVTMPNLDTHADKNSVFKGNKRLYTPKECLLIFNKVTGEITLERLADNIQVKRTRSEKPSNASGIAGNSSSNGNGSGGSGSGSVRGPSPASQMGVATSGSAPHRAPLENSTQRTVSKTRVSTGKRKSNASIVQHCSPLQGSPSYPLHRSPQEAPAWNANNNQSTLPSIPMIGMDDDDLPAIPSGSSNNYQQPKRTPPNAGKQPTPPQHQHQHHHSLAQPQRTTPNHYQQQHHNQNHQQHQQQQQQQQHQQQQQQHTGHQHKRTSPLASNTNHQLQLPLAPSLAQPLLLPPQPHFHLQQQPHIAAPNLSSSDSSSSDDSSSSGSDSDDDDDDDNNSQMNGHHALMNGGASATMPGKVADVHGDLQLTESDSD